MPARLLLTAYLLLTFAGCGRVVDRVVKSSVTYTPWDFRIIDGDDGTPICRLGQWYEGVASDTTPHAIYFVGTLAEAKRAQQERVAAILPAATSPTTKPPHATKSRRSRSRFRT